MLLKYNLVLGTTSIYALKLHHPIAHLGQRTVTATPAGTVVPPSTSLPVTCKCESSWEWKFDSSNY